MAGIGDTERTAEYQLRLFVAGNTVRSQRAIDNLRRICREYLPATIDLEVVDIYQQPEFAERYKVVAAPTLLKLQPAPVRYLVGDLSETNRVLRALGIAIHPRPEHDT